MNFKALQASYAHAQTKLVEAGGSTFAYRELGQRGGTPLVLLNHWAPCWTTSTPSIVEAWLVSITLLPSTIAESVCLAAPRQ